MRSRPASGAPPARCQKLGCPETREARFSAHFLAPVPRRSSRCATVVRRFLVRLLVWHCSDQPGEHENGIEDDLIRVLASGVQAFDVPTNRVLDSAPAQLGAWAARCAACRGAGRHDRTRPAPEAPPRSGARRWGAARGHPLLGSSAREAEAKAGCQWSIQSGLLVNCAHRAEAVFDVDPHGFGDLCTVAGG